MLSHKRRGERVEVLTNASVEHTAIGRIVIPPDVPPGFRVFYTTIDFDGRIDDRIREFVQPAKLSSCHQVHGVGVRAGFSRPDRLKPVRTHEPECDALWSDQKESALAIKVADCLPVSIIDPKKSIIANIHSGWRGAVQRITEITLNEVPLDAGESFAFLGPSIRVCCFEVGEEVASQFDRRFVDRSLGPKPHVDIPAMTIDVLRKRGVQNIVDTELCTKCDGGVAELSGFQVAENERQPGNSETRQPLFHSYRRDKKSGRNLAIVAQ
jgi:YfiH family protein